MTNPATGAPSSLQDIKSSPLPIPLRGSPPSVPQAGIAGGGSSFTRALTDSDIASPPNSPLVPALANSDIALRHIEDYRARSNSNGSLSPIEPLSRSVAEPLSPSKINQCAPDSAPPSGGRALSDLTVPMMISRIFQRFLVRMPHTFIALAGTFVPLYYGLGLESLAYSATTFVGVGGTVYCLVRAIFIEVIPEWMLPRNAETKIWRRLMNASYTGFITVIFTTAVWKLPDLSSTQGLFFFGLSFGVPYVFLAKLYPDIDKQPTWSQQRYSS